MPNNKSAISMLDFASPVELANFLHKLVKNDSAYEEYLSHKLNERDYRVTNNRLLHALGKRPTGIINEFANYMDAFECFVCEQIQNDHGLERNMVTRKQYDCPLPRDPITNEINQRNWWTQQWNIEKCGAKLLAHHITNNISTNKIYFDKQKLNMYDRNEC